MFKIRLAGYIAVLLLASSHAYGEEAPKGAKPATKAIVSANQAVLKYLPLNSKQDFKDATKGFIAPLYNKGQIKNSEGDVIWHLSQWDFVGDGDSGTPDTVNPSFWRQTHLLKVGGLFKVVEGIYQVHSADLTNITFIEAPDGIIVMGPLTDVETAKYATKLYFEHRRNNGYYILCCKNTPSRIPPGALPTQNVTGPVLTGT